MAQVKPTHSRPLLLATAGHVNHGKSTLVKLITGVDPDRLPQEKTRGMTLDLGFVNTDKISFVDCPGHDGLVRHTIAGHTGVDGAIFVVDLVQGLQEQSFEHARILNWLGVQKVLLVLTKSDLIDDSRDLQLKSEKIISETDGLFKCDLDYFVFSKVTDPNLLVEKIESFFAPQLKPIEHNYDRFFIDRAFSIKGVGTVVTGSLIEGRISAGDKLFLWVPKNRKPTEVSVRSIRRGTSSILEAEETGRIALVLDGAKPRDVSRGSCLLLEKNSGAHFVKQFSLDMDWVTDVKKEFSAFIQVGTLSHPVRLRKHPAGFWRAHSPMALPLRRHDKVIIRMPQRIKNIGHSIGGGTLLDVHLQSGKIKDPPPRDDRLFIKWVEALPKAPKNISEWMARLGKSRKNVENLLGPMETKIVSVPAKLDRALNIRVLKKLFDGRWQATVEKQDLDDAHTLVKKGLAFHISENHFIHYKVYDELLKWLTRHFEKNQDLLIEDAREFFGPSVGRKTFLNILEFCDRLHFTFRKGTGRKKFKLPSYLRPSDLQP